MNDQLSPARAQAAKAKQPPPIGVQIRKLRKEMGMTLAELAGATGLSISAVSKIENEQVSPTVVNLQRLAEALDTQMADLLSVSEERATPTARMAVTRASELVFRSATSQDFVALCVELQHKLMKPLITKVYPKKEAEDVQLIPHSGEEFVYVLKGTMDILTEYYQPVRLHEGDCIYIDSTMAHRYAAVGDEMSEALVIWVPGRNQNNEQTRSEMEAITGTSETGPS